MDWFELHGEVEYGGISAKLPALLAALRRGENMVLLDDGSYGLLPEEWLSRFGSLASLGEAGKDHIRFQRNQVGLLDALLAAQPEISCDETFTRARDALRNFEGIRAPEQPAGFIGQLRDYQREGVGWMEFLRTFGFGGCLADDMGVGKTAQVLAMLEDRRALRASLNGNAADLPDAPAGPSLVVVPKSLVFNWKQEAARFTPQLRVLDHTGLTRNVSSFADFDVVLTTYGTLRRDAAEFKDIQFDYIVLDEAQTIKNPATESAKAARLLRGRHRLALSGTPVENHLGELWSLFEFLNPRHAGRCQRFQNGGRRRAQSERRNPAASRSRAAPLLFSAHEGAGGPRVAAKNGTDHLLRDGAGGAQALRRTARVLPQLAAAHHRDARTGKIQDPGAGSAAAIAPGRVPSRPARCQASAATPAPSWMLFWSICAKSPKAGTKRWSSRNSPACSRLCGSGWTKPVSFTNIWTAKPRDRQAHVERFQNDPDCGLFLISLKAGGLGLNLTAAEYIFLLDPWWNPAVEAQAIDRAHRIGQTRPVFAYRLIARDTVEEKVLQLQSAKRDLAAAIISQDSSVIRNLQREDLELLLS